MSFSDKSVYAASHACGRGGLVEGLGPLLADGPEVGTGSGDDPCVRGPTGIIIVSGDWLRYRCRRGRGEFRPLDLDLDRREGDRLRYTLRRRASWLFDLDLDLDCREGDRLRYTLRPRNPWLFDLDLDLDCRDRDLRLKVLSTTTRGGERGGDPGGMIIGERGGGGMCGYPIGLG